MKSEHDTRTRKKDLKTTRYALTEDGEPLAYVQATNSTSQVGRTHISYPWAMPSCPVEVQEKIFDDLLAYLKQRKETLEITSPIVAYSLNIEEKIQFMQKKGFVEKERIYVYLLDLDVNEISNWEMTNGVNSFTSRLATIEDLDQLTQICQLSFV